MQITFAVPKETTSCFVIAVNRTPTGLPSVVPWRMSASHRREAAAALGSPRLAITPHGPSHVIISSTASPSCQPKSAQVARAAARAVANAYGGIIDDPLTGHVITSEFGGEEEPAAFRLADDWLGWRFDIIKDATCPHPGARSSTCTPLSVSSRGLRRFGMPEIMLDGTACAHSHRPIEFLRVVAQRLLTEHLSWLSANPATGVRAICDHIKIDKANFATPHGRAETPSTARSVSTLGAETPAKPNQESVPSVNDEPIVMSVGLRRPRGSTGLGSTGLGSTGLGVAKGRARGARRFVFVRLSREGDGRETERLKVGPPVHFDGGLDDWLRLAFEEPAFGRPRSEASGGMNLWAA